MLKYVLIPLLLLSFNSFAQDVYIQANDALAAEPSNDGQFTVGTTGLFASSVTVTYIISGTADNGVDYALISNSVTIPAGLLGATETIDIDVLNDNDFELTEEVVITLVDGPDYDIEPGEGSASLFIEDDEEVDVAINNPTDLNEGNVGTTTMLFEVTLSETNPLNDVIIDYTITGGNEDGTSSSLTFLANTGTLTQTISVATNGDTLVEPNETISVAISSSSNGTNITNAIGTADFLNDDEFVAQITATDATAAEDGQQTGDFTISLNQTNTTGSPVTVNYTIGGSATNTTDYNTIGTSVSIPNGQDSAVITITPVDDSVSEGPEDVQLTLAAGTGYSSGVSASATVTIADDDAAGIDVASVGADNDTYEDPSNTQHQQSFEVKLNSQPTANVVVTMTSDNPDQVFVVDDVQTFTPSNWDIAQRFVVESVDNTIAEGDTPYSVTFTSSSTDTNYDGVVGQGSGTDIDNDVTGISIAINGSLNTTEGGAQASFTVVLDVEPTSNVVLTVASDDPTEGVAAPASLTFTPTNWNTPQTVDVTGQDDDIVDGPVDYNVVVSVNQAASADEYDAIADEEIELTNSDNDVAGFTVVESGPGTVTGEDGTTDTFTVVLDAEPASNVRLNVNSQNTNEFTVSTAALNFTPTNWNVPQTVTVTGVDDNIDDDDQTANVRIRINNANSDDEFDGLPNQFVSVTNVDDDEVGIVVAPTTIATNEDAGTVSFTVSLLSEPTDDVNITLVSSDTEEGTVNSSVVLTPANYTNILVTVTIIDDGLVDGPDTFSIRTTEVSSDDAKYDAFGDADVDDVSITNGDTDQAAISIDDVTVTEGDAGDPIQAILSVTLNGSVSTSFTVPYTTANNTATAGEDYTATNASAVLSFNGSDGQTRNITINILSDTQIEPEESFFVNLGVPSNPSVTVTDGIGVVTIEDDDDCLAGTQAPVRQNSEPTAFCDDFSQDLDNYTTTPTDSRLKWSTQNTGRQNSANHLSSSVISAPGTYYGFYYDEINQCVSPSIEVIITASETPSVGTTTNPNTSACSVAANGNTIIDLDEQLTGTIDAGIWEYVSGPIALNPDGNNVVNFQGVSDGTYVYRFTTTTAVAPCTNQTNTVSITVNDCSIPCDAGSTAPVLNPDQPTNFCDTLNANLNDYVLGNAPNGSVLTWSTNSDPLVTSAHRSPNVSAPGAYYGFYFDDADGENPTDCASPVLVVTLELNDSPELIETQGETICGPGEVELTATATTGATINWFETETSTTILATGPTFVPTVTETTTYFVLATANGCPTERVAVVATVLEQPSVGIPTDAVACNEAGADNTTILDLDDTLEGEGNGVWSINTDNDPSNGAVVINSDGTVDFAGLPEGDYVFRFTTLGAEAPCTNQFVDVTVTVIDCLTDADEDGLDDDIEEELGTDPNDPDSDDDGILDGQEVADGTDPLDDCDSNGGTALPDSDCDNDGLTTAEEEDLGTNPNDADSDGDGLTDGEEVLIEDNPDTEAIPETATDPLDACDPFLTEDCNPFPIDLIVTKIVDINNPLVGEQVVFTIAVENATMDRAIDVVVSDVLDTSGFEYVSHNTLSGTYDLGTGEWYIPQIFGEELVSLEITVRVLREGPNQNTATLISSLPVDENIENNSETVTVTGVISDCVTCGTICNIYSPNGDGVNDVLILNCHQDYPNSLLQIYDQYGNSVFEMRAYNSTWDGTGQNGDLPKGTYFYILDLGDGTAVRKGWLQIIR
ncbi:hypothetical protein GCM10011414_24880 [Croceivirga lutea]|uniref:Calx-beta domain-containing protein n=1 Tax=Croceivirga lutea TaxID=1775167 RepID=UPI00163AD548|nr:Calx-beta domain-containing protein [Croceivirga lutea]GGG54151.1 hypothetical protein GCM10011414_24880 [Croceivirga lutea]